ncbi:hypothetical protein M0R45_005811 [Rubus argutus]|uniref:Uncharacterized protein n=1 Tax=Rubus argutus TaxID=59490 RepID=A0AAW1YP89_RUBAR
MPKLGSVVTTGACERQRETSEWIGANDVPRLTEVRQRRWTGDCRFIVEMELKMHGCRGAAVVKGRAAGFPNQLDPAAV